MQHTTQRINITVPKYLLKSLNSTIPKGTRSQFIVKAVSEKLKKKIDRQKSFEEGLKANYEYYKKEGKIWEVTLLDGLENEDFEEYKNE